MKKEQLEIKRLCIEVVRLLFADDQNMVTIENIETFSPEIAAMFEKYLSDRRIKIIVKFGKRTAYWPDFRDFLSRNRNI